MKAKSIKEIVSEYLEGTNFNEINETVNLEKAWENLTGKIISTNTKIIGLKKGVLIIKTSNPIWRNELSMQKKELLSQFNQSQTNFNIKELIFR